MILRKQDMRSSSDLHTSIQIYIINVALTYLVHGYYSKHCTYVTHFTKIPDKPSGLTQVKTRDAAAGAIFPVIERSHDMRATAATANDDRFADVGGEAYHYRSAKKNAARR